MAVADRSQHREKVTRRHDAPASPLNGFHEDTSDLALLQDLLDLVMQAFETRRGTVWEVPAFAPETRLLAVRTAIAVRERKERRPISELRTKWIAKVRQTGGRQRSVAKAMITPRKRDHTRFAGVQQCRLER